MSRKFLVILIVAIVLTVGLGYYFGYDHGWEKAASTMPEAKIAEKSKIAGFEARFAIFTDGLLRSFANPMYHFRSSDVYITDANAHKIMVKKAGTIWGDFFETLPMTLTADCLITGDGERFCNSSKKQLKFYLNDELEPNLLDMEIEPQDLAVIIYGAESEAEIKKLLQRANALIQN